MIISYTCMELFQEERGKRLHGLHSAEQFQTRQARHLIDTLQAGIMVYSKYLLNLCLKLNKNGFRHGGETVLFAVAAHNMYENVSRVQEGVLVCFSLAHFFNSLINRAKVKTNLALVGVIHPPRWRENIITCVVCCYNPCINCK